MLGKVSYTFSLQKFPVKIWTRGDKWFAGNWFAENKLSYSCGQELLYLLHDVLEFQQGKDGELLKPV